MGQSRTRNDAKSMASEQAFREFRLVSETPTFGLIT
jgi:hypothetical protein